MKAISAAFPYFTDKEGDPLDSGKLYFGVEGLNPETNPILIFQDEAGTIPLAQPVRTILGYPARYGTPCNVFASTAYSITVKTADGQLVYYSPSVGKTDQSSGGSNVVDDHGAVPNDPDVDNSDVFNEIFATSDTNYSLPAGTYNIDQIMLIDCENIEVYGVPGATIITSSTLVELAQIIHMKNVKFYGITFQCLANSGSASNGVVFGADPTITRSAFERCTFTSPTCKAAGFSINGNGQIDGLDLTELSVVDVGSKGIYISATSFQNVNVENCTIQNTALYGGELGNGVTFASGGINSRVKDCTFDNTLTTCIAVAGTSQSTFSGNRFINMSRACDVIVTDDANGIMYANVFENNITPDPVSDGGITFQGCEFTLLTNNGFSLTKPFTITDTNRIKGSENAIVTTALHAVLVNGSSVNNEFIGGVITNNTAPANPLNVTVFNSGAGVSSTRLVSVEIYKEASGNIVGAELSAPQPELISCSGDASGGSSVVTSGLKVTTGISTVNTADALNIRVDLSPSSANGNAYIGTVSVAAYSFDDPSNGAFVTANKGLFAKPTITEFVDGGTNPLIIPDFAAAGFNIQYAWLGTPGVSVEYVIDISITGIGIPVITVV